jgi:hypothetical protein
MNATSPQPVTNREFMKTLGRILHRPAFLPAPAFLMNLIFGQMARETLLASTRAIPQRLLDAGFRFETPTIDAALRHELG